MAAKPRNGHTLRAASAARGSPPDAVRPDRHRVPCPLRVSASSPGPDLHALPFKNITFGKGCLLNAPVIIPTFLSVAADHRYLCRAQTGKGLPAGIPATPGSPQTGLSQTVSQRPQTRIIATRRQELCSGPSKAMLRAARSYAFGRPELSSARGPEIIPQKHSYASPRRLMKSLAVSGA